MKGFKCFPTLMCAAIAMGGLIFISCKPSTVQDAKTEGAIGTETKAKRSETSEVTVTLDLETQKRIGLVVAPVIATNVSEELKCFGRVISPASLADSLSELNLAEVAVKNSRQEYERLKSLADNASIKSIQAAESALRRDEVAVENAKNKILLNWGKAIAERKDFPEFVRSLLAHGKVLARVDLPVGENLKGVPSTARMALFGSEDFLRAEFLEYAPNIESSLPGQSLIFLADAKDSSLVPGATVTAFLPLREKTVPGIIVPPGAVLRHEGKAWIYVQTGETTFTRREVELKQQLEAGSFISNLDSTVHIVVTGAQVLLSEELKSQIKID